MQISYIKYNKYSPDEFLKKQAIKEINKVLDKKKRMMLATCVITIAMTNINTLYAATTNIENFKIRVDSKGQQALELVQAVGYWIAIIAAAVDIIKHIKKQDVGGIIAIALKYATMFGLLYALPWLFDLIKDLFE